MTQRFGMALFSLTIAASHVLAQRPGESRALASRIDALASPEAAANRLSGILLIARGDRVVLQRTWGFADWERRVPVSSSTRIGIGSITKIMTQLVVAQLVAEGRIDLNAPVSKYLPGFPDGPGGGHATVQQLLVHRAGVPWRVTSGLEETEPLSPADVVERVKAKGLLFEPGTQELYSSAGYTALARIVEVTLGKPFDDVLAERIFRPAAMTLATGETGARLMPGRALPYILGAGATTTAVISASYKNLGFLTGAGSVYASAADMLHLVRALRAGKFGSAAAQEHLGDPADTTWSGWYGRTDGYESSVDYLPAQDLTFVFLSNLRSTANWQLRIQVRNVLRGHPVMPLASVPAVVPPFEPVESIVGPYDDAPDSIVISHVDGRLLRDGDDIYPMAGGWYYEPASGAMMRFARDAAGAVDSMVTRYPWSGKERAMRRLGP